MYFAPKTFEECLETADRQRAYVDHGCYLPTEDEIAAACKQIQRGWSPTQERDRAGGAANPIDLHDCVVPRQVT